LVISCLHSTPTHKTYAPSLHDALPISSRSRASCGSGRRSPATAGDSASGHELVAHFRPAGGAGVEGALHQRHLAGAGEEERGRRDRKSTRLNSSHVKISYAVFCLKKKT